MKRLSFVFGAVAVIVLGSFVLSGCGKKETAPAGAGEKKDAAATELATPGDTTVKSAAEDVAGKVTEGVTKNVVEPAKEAAEKVEVQVEETVDFAKTGAAEAVETVKKDVVEPAKETVKKAQEKVKATYNATGIKKDDAAADSKGLDTLCRGVAKDVMAIPQIAKAEAPLIIAVKMENKAGGSFDANALAEKVSALLTKNAADKALFVSPAKTDETQEADYLLTGTVSITEAKAAKYEFRLTSGDGSQQLWTKSYEAPKAEKKGIIKVLPGADVLNR